ncbi:MAG TPA: FAD-binding protein [Candidatus Thermoplasmatota archaeon]|nr:FAD-binding protein [Candidatus Thermoplasmatota archaeon]
MSDMGFADLYGTPTEIPASSPLEDIKGSDWRNILVLGRATTKEDGGVHPETLALVGRARFLADELGCRVEVLLVGEDLEPATEVLKRYPIDTVYRVKAPSYAPIDLTSRILSQVVRKRRPELVLVFQSRTGDAIAAYTAALLGTGFVNGASKVEVDTAERRAIVTHEALSRRYQVVTRMETLPQVVSVRRGLFGPPLEDPYRSVRVHDLELDVERGSAIEVLRHNPAPAPTVSTAERVVVVGARVHTKEEVAAAKELARRLDAVFAVTVGIVERGLAEDAPVVGDKENKVSPRLLLTVGVRGSLDFLEAIEGNPTICAVGCDPGDPIAKRAAYIVPGDVMQGIEGVLKAL